jgi:hypothetical protein
MKKYKVVLITKEVAEQIKLINNGSFKIEPLQIDNKWWWLADDVLIDANYQAYHSILSSQFTVIMELERVPFYIYNYYSTHEITEPNHFIAKWYNFPELLPLIDAIKLLYLTSGFEVTFEMGE